MIDGERLHEVRSLIDDWLVEAFAAHLNGAGFYAGAIEHVSQPNAGP